MSIIEESLQRTTDTKACRIGPGALSYVPGMFRELFGDRRAILVADGNTYRAAGEEVERLLREAGIGLEPSFIFRDPDLYAEWGYLKQLENYLSGTDAIAVAVGSGVINDLTKLSSAHLGRPYLIVGTAASMDGYTAFGASITYEGNKQTFDCPAPAGLVLDPSIAAKAPKGMSASGYADLMAKIPAAADWMLADAAGTDPIDPVSLDLVQRNLRASLSRPEEVAEGSVPETEELSIGLVMSGFAMQACKCSRPASGLEHQFSHYWDMEGLCWKGKHVSHGFKVAIGTLVSTACLEFLLDKGLEEVDPDRCAAAWPTWEKQEEQIRQLFRDKPAHAERALAESKAKYQDAAAVREQLRNLREGWNGLAARIRTQIFPFGEVRNKLHRVGAPYEPEMIGVSREKLRNTFRGIPYMRSRFTSIDLILRAGLLPEVEAALFGPGARWDTNS